MSRPDQRWDTTDVQRVLKDKLEQVADAADAGGSGDIYTGLNEEERGSAYRNDQNGLPAARLVRLQDDGNGRIPGSLSRNRHG